ncbi:MULTISPECIES: hypothetical protein [unclassified Microbacterium]|uniref:hypothetical protein n=1 Tax=unclassified Microbacterium TaxID=2609290 RepID=UPI003017CD6B
MNRKKTRLITSVEERVTDPNRWHPRIRRRVKEWAGVYTFTRRRGWEKLAPVAEIAPTPPAALASIRKAAA